MIVFIHKCDDADADKIIKEKIEKKERERSFLDFYFIEFQMFIII